MRKNFMEQPSSPCTPSYPLNSTLRPRVAHQIHPHVHLGDEEVTSMPARLAATPILKKMSRFSPCRSSLLALLFVLPMCSSAQTTAHSPGWVVLPVEEYRTLRIRAFPLERDPEPPPVEATLTRVDYDLRIDGERASGRASLTLHVLKHGWVRGPVPRSLLVR